MSFTTSRQAAYKDVFLNKDYFAEDVKYLVGYKLMETEFERRSALAAVVPITVSVSDVEEDPDLSDDNSATIDRREEIVVQCSRDPAAVNTALVFVGGISQPHLNDVIIRDIAHDPLQIPYNFTYTISDAVDTFWRLNFQRLIHMTQGQRGG